MKTIRIGTRGSALALVQAGETQRRLAAAHQLPSAAFQVVPITTSGDRIQDRALAEVGGKGLFTKEIEDALLDGRIDLAVHSSKDLPTVLPGGLTLSAFLPREDPRDAFIGRHGVKFADLPQGSTIGTSSLRRQALVRRARPDLAVALFRGNVDTRLRKLQRGDVDGTLLALAGLRRLGLADIATEVLPLETFPPAPGQGAIAIETRSGDDDVEALLAPIADPATAAALSCERAFLAALDGSCRTPIAGHASVEGNELAFAGLVIAPDGTEAKAISRNGQATAAAEIGREAGLTLLAEAGPRLLASWR